MRLLSGIAQMQRVHGVHEVAGSSPFTQTSNIKGCGNTTLLFCIWWGKKVGTVNEILLIILVKFH